MFIKLGILEHKKKVQLLSRKVSNLLIRKNATKFLQNSREIGRNCTFRYWSRDNELYQNSSKTRKKSCRRPKDTFREL